MTLPAGISKATFDQAVRQFEAAVGKPWVFTADDDVALYKDAYSPWLGEPEERVASAAVAPNSTEEVSKVLRAANQFKIPIFPISTGKNLGYGGSAPNLSGSVVLDLKRMNRILDVSEANHSALVEPGVSYFDLYRHVQERKLKVWIDVPDPGWGSPIGNALDHGGGYLQAEFRNHFDSHCGMEVVLANGEVLRTGMGALPNANTWQQYKFGAGPWIDGIFSQSNFGVVTKMGFWLMPQPEAYLTGNVLVPRRGDLGALVEHLNYVEDLGISNGMPFIGSQVFGGFLQPRDPGVEPLLRQPGGWESAELDRYAAQKGLAFWNVLLKFYGPPKVVQAQWEYCKERFSSIAGARFEDGPLIRIPLEPGMEDKVHKPEFGIPSLEMFSIGARSATNPTPSNGHVWFSPIIPRTAEAIFESNRVFSKAAAELGMPELQFGLPSTYWKRAFIYIIGFPISRDQASNKRSRESFKKLIALAAEHGWGEYRTAPAYQDDVMRTYSFNNNSLLRFHETLKDAVDPNGILSAGRYGIWPKNMRGGRKA